MMARRCRSQATRSGLRRSDSLAAGVAFREVRRDTYTPSRHSTPPTYANATGASPSSHQPSRMAIGGTTYVDTPSRLALVRASAYAHVVNASAVGNAPR